jgi:predicted RNase H-like nuclease
MNFTLEINTPERGSNLGFKTIYFNAFKINIIEKDKGKDLSKFYHIVIKLRTIDNEIIKTKSGAGRMMIAESDYQNYGRLAKMLTSYEYRNKLIDRKKIDDEFVNFILSRMTGNYQL